MFLKNSRIEIPLFKHLSDSYPLYSFQTGKTHVITILIIFSFFKLSYAQDTHYWTNQYGPRGSILGNAIIGGVKDNSAIYYNPGFLALVDSNNISVNANIYQFDALKIKDGAGKGIDLKSGQTQILPSMVSGTFRFKNLSNHKFGYAILTKNQTGIKTSARIDKELNVISDFNNPGDEEYIGQFGLKTALNEQWFGACYSYKLNKNLSFGFSAFGAYRTQLSEYSNTAKAILPAQSKYSLYITPLVAYSDIQSAEITTFRGLGKLGLAGSFRHIDFGISITTPSIPILGLVTIQRDELYSNINLNDLNLTEYTRHTSNETEYVIAADSFRFDLNQNTFTVNARQSSSTDKIKAVYKTPFSIAGGIVFKSDKLDEYSTPTSKLYLSFEYFTAIKSYHMVKPEERGVIRPLKENYPYTSIDFMGIVEAPKSILNFALGYEQKVSQKIMLLGSIRTNNSYNQGNFSSLSISQTFWDLWHFSVGGMYKKLRSDIFVGFSYCHGFGNMDPYVVLSDPQEKMLLQGELYETKALFRSFSFSLGYNYYIKNPN